ncbi:hypothetical protein PYCC9005_004935 [Savitreella phatthalungensis]
MSGEKSKAGSHFPLGGDGPENSADRGTATCYCGAVQISFPTKKPGLGDTFVCHCTDCRKITASLFATNFIVKFDQVKHLRGQELLTKFAQSKTIASGFEMANYFCSKCGSLMYRIGAGFPGSAVLRVGTVDDFHLHETVLKPRLEQFCDDRATFLNPQTGVEQQPGNFFDARKFQPKPRV